MRKDDGFAQRAPVPSDLAGKLVEAAADAFVIVDTQGLIVLVNAQAEAMFGYPRAELLGRSVEILLPLRLRDAHASARVTYIRDPSPRRMGARKVSLSAETRDGRELPVDVSLTPVRLGEEMFIVAMVRDASERRHTETALRGAVAHTRAAIEQAPDGIFTADLDGRYTDVNEAACRMLGFERSEILGKTILDLIPPEDVTRLSAARERLLTPGSVDVSEWRLRRKNGTLLPVEVSAKILSDGRWQAIVRDISERKRVQSALSLHSIILANMAEGVILVRVADARIVYTNPRLDRMLGYQPGELVGQPVAVVNHAEAGKTSEDVAQTIINELRAAGEFHGIVQNVRKDGSPLCCSVSVVSFDHPEIGPVWVAVHEDISERRKAEEAAERMRRQLAIADRLSSMGTLAAGVAHEINNPLTYVLTNLELVGRDIRELARHLPRERTNTLLEMIEEARVGADRVRKIVRGLRALSRSEEDAPVMVDLLDVLETAINMTFHEIRQKARLVREYEAVPPVRADEAQLVQVFINLLMNGVQAIAPGDLDGNEIRIVTRTRPPGDVVVEIHDSGAGIAGESLGRVFDPFFTTKPVGEGTGLGLSISHSIVTALGGSIEVDSVLGRGSVFRVVLPAAATDLPDGSDRAAEGQRGAPARAAILVVEDDPLVARSLARMLAGYEIATAANGQQALDLLASGRDFDVIVCDLMMPVMTGMELYARLSRERPHLVGRMVFVTGGTFGPEGRAFLEQVPNARLEKPFSQDALRAVVQHLLR